MPEDVAAVATETAREIWKKKFSCYIKREEKLDENIGSLY